MVKNTCSLYSKYSNGSRVLTNVNIKGKKKKKKTLPLINPVQRPRIKISAFKNQPTCSCNIPDSQSSVRIHLLAHKLAQFAHIKTFQILRYKKRYGVQILPVLWYRHPASLHIATSLRPLVDKDKNSRFFFLSSLKC